MRVLSGSRGFVTQLRVWPALPGSVGSRSVYMRLCVIIFSCLRMIHDPLEEQFNAFIILNSLQN
jgi:hypothetical protein